MSALPAFSRNFTRSGLLRVICGTLCAALGMIVLIGWHTGNSFLVQIRTEFIPMQYLTAVGFILSGAGLISFSGRFPRLVPMTCGTLAGAIGLFLTIEHVTGWSAVSRAFLPHLPGIPDLPQEITSAPTAAGFAAAGTAILLLRTTLGESLKRLLIWILGSSVIALGLMALCAYKLGVRMIFVSGDSIGMAACSAGGFMVLGLGLLAAQWSRPHRLIDDRWLPVPIGLGTLVASLMLWQAMTADRTWALRRQGGIIARSVAADTLNRFTFCVRALNRIKLRWERAGATPYPEWVGDARDCLQDEPVFEAVGRTGADWKVTWAQSRQGAELLPGRDLRAETRWDAARALEDSIRNRRMLISPIYPVRGEDKGFAIFLPMFTENQFGGFVFGIFRLEDLKKNMLDQPAFATCRIAVFEGDRFILGELPEGGGQSESKIEFRGHVWRFVVEPRSGAMAGGGLPVMILCLGMLLGPAVAAAVWGFQRMQAEIIERQLAERNLRESERRLGLVLDSATGVSVIAFDPGGLITYFSKGAERLLGYRAEEMTGRRPVSILHDPDEMAAREVLLAEELGHRVEGIGALTEIPRLRGGERGEWIYLRQDGSPRTVDLMVTVLRNPDGSPAGYLGTAVDITERRRMEQDLRETLRGKKTSRALLEAAGRIARLGHWEFSLAGGELIWSEITCAIHELPPGTPVTLKRALDFYHPEDRPAIAEAMRKASAGGPAFEAEVRLITAGKREIWVCTRGEPVVDEKGTVIAVHGILQDIDARRKAAELLKQRNIQLEAATLRAEAHARAKAEFLANMSHEIRTPLNAVIGMSELLMDGRLDSRERGFVDTIHSSGEVLLGLINDILDFSKIESGHLGLEHIPVSPRECVESVLDLLAGQASRKKLGLAHWIDPEVPERVLGDPTRLRQVLLNLAGNAVKFTAEGEVFIRLSVRRDESGASLLHAAVTDTGIGIPADRMRHLFSAFSQGDASTTRRFGGTGLGLAISHRLIRKMKGRIWAESREGEGSTFQFEIPLRLAAPPSAPATSGAWPEAAGLEGRRVLIVDKGRHSRRMLCGHMEAWGLRVSAAGNEEEALALMAGGAQFDLTVMDAMISGTDGETAAARMRGASGGQDPPILLLTSLEESGDSPKPPGIAGILSKPVKAAPLLQAVRDILIPAPPSSAPRVMPPADSGESPDLFCPLRILVAEDNPVNQRVVTLHLQRMGYQAVMTSNGLEALLAVRREFFDVLLLDVQMPVMDGLETAREIRASVPPAARPWIIALTANAFGSDRDECLAAGMDDYLSKPVRADKLRRALRTAYEAKCGRLAPDSVQLAPCS